MSEQTPEQILAELTSSDRRAYLEQRIFVLSPFRTSITAALIFLLLAGSYALIAFAEGLPIFVTESDGLNLDIRARIAFILSLLMATVLGIQRYTRERERAEIMNAATIFRGGLATVARMSTLTPANARLGAASFVGCLIGAVVIYLGYGRDGNVVSYPGIFIWFSIVTLLLTMSFARGVELTRSGSQSGVEMIERELIIDLLRIDRLSFLGRSAARFALIWFTVGAVSALFFVSSGINGFTLSLMAMMVLIGAATFIGMMERIHRRIRAAKEAELEKLRTQIDAVRDSAYVDAGAAEKLQGLLAYETRIAAAPEWPFDQTTLMRVCASALILTFPWFGQAIAAYLIEHMGAR